MTKNFEERANELVKELEAMDMFERSEFMRIITEPFCKHCWCADPYCQCWNDE